jgi:hypothetical protein
MKWKLKYYIHTHTHIYIRSMKQKFAFKKDKIDKTLVRLTKKIGEKIQTDTK